jgi:hypothetical protein
MDDDKNRNGIDAMKRFEDALGKIVRVSKEELDKALNAEKGLAEKVEEIIRPASDEEPE